VSAQSSSLAAARSRVGERVRRGGREFATLLLSTVIFHAARIGIGLWAAAVLGPERFGRWNLLAVLVGYASHAHLGVLNAMGREVPIALGRGDRASVSRLEGVGFAAALVAAAAVLVGAGAALLAPGVRAWVEPSVVLLAATMAAGNLPFLFVTMRARSRLEFANLSIQFGIAGCVTVLSYALWGRGHDLSGLAACCALGYAAACLLALTTEPATPRFRDLRPQSVKPLIAIGFPLLSAGILYSLLTSIDRWVIVHFLGVLALGHYTLAIVAFGAASLVPQVVSQLSYPRMGRAFGRLGDAGALRGLAWRQSLQSVAVTLPALALLWLALPPLTARFLPAYVEGVGAARILLLGVCAYSLAIGPANLLVTTGRQRLYLALQAVSVALNALLSAAAAAAGFGLAGVAAGSAVALALYTVGLLVAAGGATRPTPPA
jgi:O-antigen/teichoic acid export membrane protein